jgi:hypothetical protein
VKKNEIFHALLRFCHSLLLLTLTEAAAAAAAKDEGRAEKGRKGALYLFAVRKCIHCMYKAEE